MPCTHETHPVAFTILDQIGGQRRLVTMTGAKDFLVSEDSVQFAIGRGAKDGINKVVIKLNGWDTYDVTFYRVTKRGLNCKLVVEHKGITCSACSRTQPGSTSLSVEPAAQARRRRVSRRGGYPHSRHPVIVEPRAAQATRGRCPTPGLGRLVRRGASWTC